MDFVNRLDGVQVVNTGVQANLVEHNDACIFGSLIELPHGGADIAGGDDMGLALDSGLDHLCVVGVRNQGDNEIVVGDGLAESFFVVDVERDGIGVGEVGSQSLSTGQSAAGYIADLTK